MQAPCVACILELARCEHLQVGRYWRLVLHRRSKRGVTCWCLPLVLRVHSPEVQERFASLKKRVSDVGKHRVAAYFQALERNPVRLQQYRWVESNLEGVDVYFDGIPLDGHLDSKTKFCKM